MPRITDISLLDKLEAALTPARCLLLAGAFFILMLAIGAIPGKATALSSVIPDKLLHFVAYSFLSLLLYAGLPGSRLLRALGTLLLIAALGGLDEAIQELMPYRNSNVADWEFDMLAASLWVICLTILHPLYLAARKQGTEKNRPPVEAAGHRPSTKEIL